MKRATVVIINFLSLIISCFQVQSIVYSSTFKQEEVYGGESSSSVLSGPCSAANPTLHGPGYLTGTVNLYNIFIGYSDDDYKIPYQINKATSTAGIIEAFASSFSNSDYAKILTTYGGAATSYTFKGNVFYNVYRNITSFTDSSIDVVVNKAVQTNSGWTATDKNGIYNVIFRGDISYYSSRVGGLYWNTYWCGYHTVFNGQSPISFLGDEAFVSDQRLRAGCMLQYYETKDVYYVPHFDPQPKAFSSPNGNPAADALVSVYAHEVVEAVSDTNGNGWYRLCDNQENADICMWKFADVYQTIDGRHYNIILNGNKFLIQTNWIINSSPKVSGCVMNVSDVPISTYPNYKDINSPSTLELITATLVGGSMGVGLFLVISMVFYFIRSRRRNLKKLEKKKMQEQQRLGSIQEEFTYENAYGAYPTAAGTTAAGSAPVTMPSSAAAVAASVVAAAVAGNNRKSTAKDEFRVINPALSAFTALPPPPPPLPDMDS